MIDRNTIPHIIGWKERFYHILTTEILYGKDVRVVPQTTYNYNLV